MPEEGLWGFVLSLGAGTCETPIRRWQHGWRSEDTGRQRDGRGRAGLRQQEGPSSCWRKDLARMQLATEAWRTWWENVRDSSSSDDFLFLACLVEGQIIECQGR